MSLVRGDNCIVYFYESGSWVPYACALTCSLDVQTDFIETSTTGTGRMATFSPTKNSFTGSIEGLVSLGDAGVLSLPDLRQKQLSQELLLLRFQRTAENGSVYTDECNFYISSSSDSGAFGNAASFNIGLRGTGNIKQIFTSTAYTPHSMKRFEYTGTGGEVSFSDPLLIDKDIIEVNKDGIGNSKIITGGTPASKQVLYTASTGTLEWAIPFEPGEEAYVLYQDL